jgi:hypothetical protein
MQYVERKMVVDIGGHNFAYQWHEITDKGFTLAMPWKLKVSMTFIAVLRSIVTVDLNSATFFILLKSRFFASFAGIKVKFSLQPYRYLLPTNYFIKYIFLLSPCIPYGYRYLLTFS